MYREELTRDEVGTSLGYLMGAIEWQICDNAIAKSVFYLSLHLIKR